MYKSWLLDKNKKYVKIIKTSDVTCINTKRVGNRYPSLEQIPKNILCTFMKLLIS